MPNRIIKEGICANEQIDRLTAFEETFFYRLIVNVDDYGLMDGRVSDHRERRLQRGFRRSRSLRLECAVCRF